MTLYRIASMKLTINFSLYFFLCVSVCLQISTSSAGLPNWKWNSASWREARHYLTRSWCPIRRGLTCGSSTSTRSQKPATWKAHGKWAQFEGIHSKQLGAHKKIISSRQWTDDDGNCVNVRVGEKRLAQGKKEKSPLNFFLFSTTYHGCLYVLNKRWWMLAGGKQHKHFFFIVVSVLCPSRKELVMHWGKEGVRIADWASPTRGRRERESWAPFLVFSSCFFLKLINAKMRPWKEKILLFWAFSSSASLPSLLKNIFFLVEREGRWLVCARSFS